MLCSLPQYVSIPEFRLTEIAHAKVSARGFYWKNVGALKQFPEETGWKIKGPRVTLLELGLQEMQM